MWRWKLVENNRQTAQNTQEMHSLKWSNCALQGTYYCFLPAYTSIVFPDCIILFQLNRFYILVKKLLLFRKWLFCSLDVPVFSVPSSPVGCSLFLLPVAMALVQHFHGFLAVPVVVHLIKSNITNCPILVECWYWEISIFFSGQRGEMKEFN